MSCQLVGMDMVVGLLLAIGVGWIVWSMLSPPVQFRISARQGRVRISGPHPPPATRDIEEFFAENFPESRAVRVTVAAPSSRTQSRIHIAGRVTDGEKQLIRNFLLTRI